MPFIIAKTVTYVSSLTVTYVTTLYMRASPTEVNREKTRTAEAVLADRRETPVLCQAKLGF